MKGTQLKIRLKTPLTPISRLSKMTVPIKMVGDPEWAWQAKPSIAWASRERAVFAYEKQRLEERFDPFTMDTYQAALCDNDILDRLIEIKWDVYESAWEDNILEYDLPEAERINSNHDYHRDYCLDVHAMG